MITLYFVQHGIAHPKDVDSTRPLTDGGAREVRKVATRLKTNGIGINKIFHSGKLRAAQTAEIFSEIMEVADISELSGLNPKDDPDSLISQFSDDTAMYVGHLPNIQKVISSLTSDDPDRVVIKFQNAAVACLDILEGKGYIKWYLTPELC